MRIEALISRHMYISKKNLYLPREGEKVGGLKRVYRICSKSTTYSTNSQENQKRFLRVINYHHVILFSFHFSKIVLLEL